MNKLLLLPELLAERGRVSQGIPSLLPEKRAAIGYRERQRFKTRLTIADAQAKKKQATAPDGQRDRTKETIGYSLTPGQLMKRLIRLCPRLHFERSHAAPSQMGIYLLDESIEGGKRFICGMHADDPMPEFSVLNESGAYEDKRGWRTVLYRLIKQRLITEAQAEVVFGPQGNSKNWAILTGRRSATE